MEECKHTPGNWRIGTRHGERTIYGPKGEEIAVFTGMLENEEELANARLIASAPDLLGTLKNVENCILNGTESALDYALELINEALDKAEGHK